jgi:pimeloyl-ACP methyl ester carboxylesterase
MLPLALVEPALADNAQLEYRAIPGAGHSPHREQWPATIAAIRDWLSRN